MRNGSFLLMAVVMWVIGGLISIGGLLLLIWLGAIIVKAVF